MGRCFLCCIIFFSFIGCSWRETEPVIKRDYVINPNWTKTNNMFEISRMEYRNSDVEIDVFARVTEPDLRSKLVEDTSFSFVSNVEYNGNNYSERKIYFNKYNGFVWSKPPNLNPSLTIKQDVIGELKLNNWYALGGLSNLRVVHYIFIDSLNNIHKFTIQP